MSTPAAGRLQDRLGRFGNRLSGSSLGTGTGGFLAWWANALASWLPPRARQLLGMDRGRLLLQVEGDALRLRLQRGDEIRDLGNLPVLKDFDAGSDPLAPLLEQRLADLPRWLLLPAGSSLRRRLALPAAAAERLRDVVGFEIERQTPFAADAVAYDARVLVRREGEGPIDAELVAVPRAALDPQLAALGPVAPLLAGIDVAGADGVPLQVNLLPPAQRQNARDPWATWNLVLAAVAVVAVALTLWQMLENRRAAADAFDAEIARESGPARRAAAQRQELVNLIEGHAFLQRMRADYPPALEVMDELSQRLPDGTYLEKLAIEGDRITLIGLSTEAPALIGRLQDSKLWRSPALAGALQTDPTTRKDRFTLTAEIGPADTKEAAGGNAGQ
ncbi:PilN domain-containing protein [Lysobacter solisilvae (ex Woo and Kim 2020)]|uniref:PilN domain-containing protein n=1 Tax=Agrilutibacter terrestris TaxID=2865112 RepID=A0A7H0FZB7_9GAMM|nr:PilN domain-containing protein [Lysobacter terrestris]QNP41383.1 PilN domain-containing protein [Lysobacter terrestris]